MILLWKRPPERGAVIHSLIYLDLQGFNFSVKGVWPSHKLDSCPLGIHSVCYSSTLNQTPAAVNIFTPDMDILLCNTSQ